MYNSMALKVGVRAHLDPPVPESEGFRIPGVRTQDPHMIAIRRRPATDVRLLTVFIYSLLSSSDRRLVLEPIVRGSFCCLYASASPRPRRLLREFASKMKL